MYSAVTLVCITYGLVIARPKNICNELANNVSIWREKCPLFLCFFLLFVKLTCYNCNYIVASV
uniref:Uncharacterized protein n=1 Tax=Solanum lycopersicum TaxID=4081 RepID=A0A3Q7JJZ8_SOLLC